MWKLAFTVQAKLDFSVYIKTIIALENNIKAAP